MGSNRVNRGGSWNNNASNCRSANRNNNNPDNSNYNIGFRFARSSKKMEFSVEQVSILSHKGRIEYINTLLVGNSRKPGIMIGMTAIAGVHKLIRRDQKVALAVCFGVVAGAALPVTVV